MVVSTVFVTRETPAEQCYVAAVAFEDMLGELPSSLVRDAIIEPALCALKAAILALQGAALLSLAQDGQLTIKDCA